MLLQHCVKYTAEGHKNRVGYCPYESLQKVAGLEPPIVRRESAEETALPEKVTSELLDASLEIARGDDDMADLSRSFDQVGIRDKPMHTSTPSISRENLRPTQVQSDSLNSTLKESESVSRVKTRSECKSRA